MVQECWGVTLNLGQEVEMWGLRFICLASGTSSSGWPPTGWRPEVDGSLSPPWEGFLLASAPLSRVRVSTGVHTDSSPGLPRILSPLTSCALA